MREANRVEAPGIERTLQTQIKIYYDLHVPAGGASAAPLLIALHGYGSNKLWMMREARRFAPADFAIVSLQGFHQHTKEPRAPGAPLRYGFGWLTNFHPEDSHAIHHDSLIQITRTLVREGVADSSRIFLLGFSQSCALNYRFAFTHADVLRGVVGICGGLPGDWETSALYTRTRASVLHLHGTRDEFYPPARVEDYPARLRARAADVEVRAYDAGHEFVPAMHEDLRRWLAERAASTNDQQREIQPEDYFR